MLKHSHSPHHNQSRSDGQGLVEYGIILLLVGIAVVLALVLLRPAIEDAFNRFVENAPVAPPSIGPIGGNFTPRPAPTISFSTAAPTASESLPFATINLSLSYAFYQDVSVTVSTQEDTSGASPATPGVDYTTTSVTVVIPEGSTSGTMQIPILDDLGNPIQEPDETVILTLSNASVPNVGDNAILTILDDDVPPVFSFTESLYSINEDRGPLRVVVTMDRLLGVPATVNLNTVNTGSAAGGACSGSNDYQAYSNHAVVIPAGTISQTVSICINNDSIPETNETFRLSLTAVSPPGSGTNPTQPLVTIVDDETPPTITFTQTNVIVDESGPNVYLGVQLNRPYSTQVVVSYQTFSGPPVGGASRGQDFTATDSPLTFAPGQTLKIITIPINDDGFAEDDETFTVQLLNPDPPNIPIGPPNTATVTILDNDCEYGPFNVPGDRIEAEDFSCGAEGVTHHDSDGTNNASPSSAYRVVDAPGVDVRAKNTGSSSENKDISQTAAGEWLNYDINVTTSTAYDLVVRASSTVNNASFRIRVGGPNGTIISGSSPVPVPNTGNANTFQNITVPGIALLQGARVLTLEIVGGGANYDYMEINNTAGASIFFNAASYTVAENGGQATITVDLSFVRSVSVYVNYATSNGTATAGQDYTVTSGVLEIPPFQPNATFNIPILNDGNIENPAETVNITLSNPVNGQLGAPSTAILYILDDECSFGPYTVPGQVEAENFNCGGQGSAYNDTTTGNQGTSSYRFWESVDLYSGGTSNGVYVGGTVNGEWMDYRVNVSTAGFYNVTVRAAANAANAQFSLQVDGSSLYGPFSVPNNGAGNYSNIRATGVYLAAGQHTIRLNIINGNATYDYLNFTTLSGLLLTLNDDNNTITGPSNVPLAGVNDEDIVLFADGSYSLFFDGSDVGVGQNLQGFQVLSDGTILMTFANLFNSGGNTYNPEDIVRFTPTSLGTSTTGSFSMYFDGSLNSLGDTSGGRREYIDGFFVTPEGYILISTEGNLRVPAVPSGNLDANDEDIIRFNPGPPGTYTWYFDGSDVGFGANTAGENIDAIWVSGNSIYFSTVGNFSVSDNGTSVSGKGNDIAIFVTSAQHTGSNTDGSFNSTRYFVGDDNGLSGELVDGFFILP